MSDPLSDAYLNPTASRVLVDDGDTADQLVCDGCGWGDLEYDVGTTALICPECGLVSHHVDLSFGRVLRPRTSPYQCIFYLHERIKQLEIGEAAIPNDDFERIREAMAKQGGPVDKPAIQRALRSLRGNFSKRYLERWLQIRRRLGGSRPAELTSADRLQLDAYFRAYEQTYKKYVRPPGRKHLLHYNYVLRQLCRLIQRHDLEEYFPLLKTREKLAWTEAQWMKVCERTYWPFYSQLTETSRFFHSPFTGQGRRHRAQQGRLHTGEQTASLPVQRGLGRKKAQHHEPTVKRAVIPRQLVDNRSGSHRAEHARDRHLHSHLNGLLNRGSIGGVGREDPVDHHPESGSSPKLQNG